jgi:sporulation protein YlmC with PRC-barrel domain
MKKTILSLAAAAALAATIPAFAQQKAPDAAAPAAKTVQIPKGVYRKGQPVNQYSVKERLLGAKVVNKAGEVVGDIEDLVLLGGSNTIDTVIIGVGGVLGVGEKKIGVAYDALTIATKDGKRTITLDTTKDILAAVVPYKYAEPPKTMLQKATEASQAAAKKASEVTKSAVEKAKEAVKGKTEAPKAEAPKTEAPKAEAPKPQ